MYVSLFCAGFTLLTFKAVVVKYKAFGSSTLREEDFLFVTKLMFSKKLAVVE